MTLTDILAFGEFSFGPVNFNITVLLLSGVAARGDPGISAFLFLEA